MFGGEIGVSRLTVFNTHSKSTLKICLKIAREPRAKRPAGANKGRRRRWPAPATRRESCAFGAKGHREGSQGAAEAEGTAFGAVAAVDGRRRPRAPLRRPGRGRCPAATTGRESCAFAAEGPRGRGSRAAAAEGTASGAAEAAATEDGDALGRP